MVTAKNLTWITTSNPNGSFADWLRRNNPDAKYKEPESWFKENPFTVTKEKIDKDEYIPIQRNDFMVALNEVMVRKMYELKEDELIKNCGNCKHSRQPICEACYEYVHWEAKEEKMASCANCKYENRSAIEQPCKPCKLHDRWEPKEDEMDNRLKKIQNELMKFAREKRLGYESEYDSFTNRLKAKFTEGPFCKKYEIHGDGCNPNVMIADITRDLTQFFKLKSSTMYGDLPSIKNVIFNDPATIIFWTDGTKTVVKAQDEPYDPEKGMAMAIAKKALGNQGNYCNVFKKWLPEEEEVEKEMTITDAMAAISEFAKHFNLGEVDFRLVPKEGNVEEE